MPENAIEIVDFAEAALVGDLRNVQMRIEVINRIRLTRDSRSPSTKHENDKPSCSIRTGWEEMPRRAAGSFVDSSLLPSLAMMSALAAS
jgi:hypothetical protein